MRGILISRNTIQGISSATIELVNGHLLDTFVAADRAAGHVRTYAMKSAPGRAAVFFLLNKDSLAVDVNIRVTGLTAPKITKCIEFVGQSPDDTAPATRARPALSIANGTMHGRLAPLSLTIMTAETGGKN
ncbi:MAG: hypothetical protein Q7S40_02795 [Opitutaceae bacterium]|nr:hypothetical protein [Opitutaceae bacterium]